MRSHEQLWLQSPLSSSVSGISSKQARWRAMAVKRLLMWHIHSQGRRRGSDHYNLYVYPRLQGEAQPGHGYGAILPQGFPVCMNVNGRGHRNVESMSTTQQQMQVHVQNCTLRENGTQQQSLLNWQKTGLGYGVFRAQQQVQSLTRGSGGGTHHPQVDSQICEEVPVQQYSNLHKQSHYHRGNKSQEPLLMNREPVAQQQEMEQGHEALAQHEQQTVVQRPLPKHLLPIPMTRRSLSTISKSPPFRKSIAVTDTIHLTDLELKIFNTLKAFLVHFQLKTQLRVAGGWVRDKLLGRQCSGDIDIALDDMLGRTFCRRLTSYCRMVGVETSGFGVIKSNPMHAKHLEVAKMEIFGVAIDFVNLRPDDFAESSGKSFTMQDFGTIVEDAFRRDLTINSIFYNINTGMVEDPTGKGLSDLKAGIIATPLAAKVTFGDDPLRALRALRFGMLFGNFLLSVLDYELHPDAKDAIDADIKVALAAKISRERIGGEVERIFRCSQPLKAMELLVETQLFPVVFSPPTEIGVTLPDGIERTCLRALGATVDVVGYFGSSKLSGEQRKSLYLAAFLSPLRAYVYEHRSKLVSISTAIIKETLKLRSIDAAMVATLHKTADNYTSIRKFILKMHTIEQGHEDHLISDLELQISYSHMKHQIGKLLEEARGLWRSALLLGTVLEEDCMVESPFEKSKEELKRRSNLCIFVEEAIVKLGLEDITGPFPFVDRRRVSDNG